MPRHATTFLDMKRNLAEAQIAERLKTPWILIIYWRAVEFTCSWRTQISSGSLPVTGPGNGAHFSRA